MFSNMLHVFFGLANSYPAMMKHHDHILIDSWIPHHPFGSHWPIVPPSLYSLPIILKEKKLKKSLMEMVTHPYCGWKKSCTTFG